MPDYRIQYGALILSNVPLSNTWMTYLEAMTGKPLSPCDLY